MKNLRGVAASPGASVAPAWLHNQAPIDLPAGTVDDRETEVERLRGAIEGVAQALEEQASKASGELAEVLEAQAMMARDPELATSTEGMIKSDGTYAARAIIDAGEGYAEALAASDSEYMAARAGDIRDVCSRIARRCLGVPETEIRAMNSPGIVVATELPPADVASLDKELVKGIATQEGSRSSHTAIVARAFGIPAVVAVSGLMDAISDDSVIALDGDEGTVHVDPDDDTRECTEQKTAARTGHRAQLLKRVREGPSATNDGRVIEMAANAGSVAELRSALEAGAEGVGLLRTELLYIDRAEPPNEDEQVALLEEMTGLLGDRRLVVRTFDFGADKPVPFLDMEAVPNPALGVRGIRLAREQPELLETQLHSITRAAQNGKLAVMAPMVASVAEAEWFVEQVKRAGGIDAGVEVGVMVEVPSAVLVAEMLAERLDFLSIGTNDLAQYLHAADRQQGSLSYLQDPFSPALLRAVEQVCSAARDKAWVGVCGEAAGDPAWALVAVGLGVMELSMGTDSLLEVRVAVGEHSFEECRSLADEVLAAGEAEEARHIAEALVS
ncbi:MAG: phosphoenolpyruvate--protein phosphotransferase [Actinomycetota bacterium]